MLEHTVIFTLIHDEGSFEEQDFLKSLRSFSDIPGVENFKINRQVSTKSPFTFQISMRFTDQQALEAYDASQAHVDFVNTRWIPEVQNHQTLDFIEI